MKVGVPTEVKPDEYRVALTPVGARELAEHGHEVLIQKGAGEGSAISDCRLRGPRVPASCPTVEDVWGERRPGAEGEGAAARGGSTAACREHAVHVPPSRAGARSDPRASGLGATCVAYETVEDRAGPPAPARPDVGDRRARSPPRPAPSCSRSRSADGASCSAACRGWRPANVMIIGGGAVGMNAAFIAIGMEADVFVYDTSIDRLRDLDIAFGGRASTVFSSTLSIEERLPQRRPGDRGGAPARGESPARDQAIAAEADAAACGARRRGDRPGRLLRDVEADHPSRPDVRGRRRDPLLRHEHARRGADHVHLRAHQRDPAVRARARRPRGRRGRPARPRPEARDQRRRRQGHPPGGRRGRWAWTTWPRRRCSAGPSMRESSADARRGGRSAVRSEADCEVKTESTGGAHGNRDRHKAARTSSTASSWTPPRARPRRC